MENALIQSIIIGLVITIVVSMMNNVSLMGSLKMGLVVVAIIAALSFLFQKFNKQC